MNDRLDELLQEVLQEKEIPSSILNRQIINQAGMEEKIMKKTKRNVAAAVVALSVVLAGGGTAYAAYHYLTAGEIADAVSVSDNRNLAEAFDSQDAIVIDKSQESGDYVFQLLGIVTGSHLEPYVTNASKADIDSQKTYITMAISKKDGSAMANKKFCISPLIGGVSFEEANNETLKTEMTWFEQDGVMYELVECDDLGVFADQGVWISAVDSFGDERNAFVLNPDGSYTKNAEYQGVSALFVIPFDSSGADNLKE